MTDSELFSYAKQLQVPIDLLRETAKLGRLPVVNFAAGGLGGEGFLLFVERRSTIP
jgi:pyridoxal 5'-phosphate synthase pdxS subunit